MSRHEYASTHGIIRYDEDGDCVTSVDDPESPDGEGWNLVSAAPTGHCRFSRMAIVWTWRRETPDE